MEQYQIYSQEKKQKKTGKRQYINCQVTVEDLHNYFKSMFGKSQPINTQDDMSEFDHEQESVYEELDYEFTEPEVVMGVTLGTLFWKLIGTDL